jgi:hypothetical protein
MSGAAALALPCAFVVKGASADGGVRDSRLFLAHRVLLTADATRISAVSNQT